MPVIGRVSAHGMLREKTPVQDYRERYGILVKREDLACLPPGPPFSKTRGVFAHVAKRPEKVIGVLDTFHSQAGWAVARACQILGKTCINYYPVYKADTGLREPQLKSRSLGAVLTGLPAGRSCILFHQAKKATERLGGYMMPNALKLAESVEETAKEVKRSNIWPWPDLVIIPSSSATIAAGVIRGFGSSPRYVIHLGYSRSHESVLSYVRSQSGVHAQVDVVDERYSYKEQAGPGETPPWPCNPYYDLKAFRWWIREGWRTSITGGLTDNVLFWNIG